MVTVFFRRVTGSGILATTFAQIAERADVPVEAVTERFPTPEALVPECGGLAFRRMRVPPPEEALTDVEVWTALGGGERADEVVRPAVAALARG